MQSALSFRATVPSLILLVDDNLDGILARTYVLQELGYQILTARSAEEALELMKEHQFDLLVTDFKMAQMDGLGLITTLRNRGHDLPVILLSGFAETLGLNATDTGASLVIQKNKNEVDQLLRGIQRLLKPAKKPASSQPSLALTAKIGS